MKHELELAHIHFLQGGKKGSHKIDALTNLLPKLSIVPTLVSAIEPDHHRKPIDLIQAKYEAFYNAWDQPSDYNYLSLVADVTTDFGDSPIRKPTSTNLVDLSREIADTTARLSSGGNTNISFVEHAAVMVGTQRKPKHFGVSTTQITLPVTYLSDHHFVYDALNNSGLPEATILNMSGGIEGASMLAFLHKRKKIGDKTPRELVHLPKKLDEHLKSYPKYIYQRLEFYESIGRINSLLLKQLDSITLLGLLESGLNMPGPLILPLINSILATPPLAQR